MSLSSALPTYKSNIQNVFSNISNSYSDAASGVANSTRTWAVNGVPRTTDSGTLAGGQAVAGFVTVSPGAVSGSGIGGIDTTTVGGGLAAAKSALISDLTSVFSNTGNSASSAAQGFTNALATFFSKAKVQTSFTGTAAPGVPVPAPAGPVGSSAWSGSGSGGIDTSSPGSGFSATINSFISGLTSVFSNTGNSPASAASSIANQAHAFLSSAIVVTIDSGTAAGGPASVNPDTGSGATLPPGSAASGSSSSGTLS